MKIIQLVLNYSSGDGVGNCLNSMSVILDQLKIENFIWAMEASLDLHDKKLKIIRMDDLQTLKDEDILFYHFYIGCDLNRDVENLTCKKILIYQNVTPARFFKNIHFKTYFRCLQGENDARNTVDHYLKCITPSAFSKNELIKLGWNEKDISVIPIFDVQDNQTSPDDTIVKKYSDGNHNFIFTGRIAPNKKIEDVIKIFDYYQKNFDSNARLFIVGGIPYSNYYKFLTALINQINAKNIIFTGRILQEELEAYYRVSDVYLCMSEHEGFCLPILEAMQRGLLVIAYNSTAVPDTMKRAGILIDSKEPEAVCKEIANILFDKELYSEKILEQKEHVKRYNIKNYIEPIYDVISEMRQLDQWIYKQCDFAKIGNECALKLSDILNNTRKQEIVVLCQDLVQNKMRGSAS